MTIGLCTPPEMMKLSCPSLPPSSPEILRVSNHQCDFGEENSFKEHVSNFLGILQFLV